MAAFQLPETESSNFLPFGRISSRKRSTDRGMFNPRDAHSASVEQSAEDYDRIMRGY